MAVTPEQPRRRGTNRYTRIVESVFHAHYEAGQSRVEFEREEIIRAAARLNIELPKNLGDVIYGFRYRVPLPESILATAPPGPAYGYSVQTATRLPSRSRSSPRSASRTAGLRVARAEGHRRSITTRCPSSASHFPM